MAVVCPPVPGEFPWAPSNGMAMSAFHSSDTDIRWDDPAALSTGPTVASAESVTSAVVEVILVGTPTVEALATGSFQVIAAPLLAGETVEIDGIVLTVTDGPPSTTDEFDGSSTDPAVVAENLREAIASGSPGTWRIVTVARTGTLVTVTAVPEGTEGNAITLLSTAPRVVASGETLLGGALQTVVSLNGIEFGAVSGARTSGERDFSITNAAASLADAINDPANGISTLLYAERSGYCVRVISRVEGEAGNGIPVTVTTDAFLLSSSATVGGVGTPCPPGQTNANWNIVGVNVYRSDSGDRGPYFRVNQVPIQALFFRDRTDIVEVANEIVLWDGGWIFKGDSANNKGWRLRTRNLPVVKRFGNGVSANAPTDVSVTVDGEEWPVAAVFGPRGEIDMSMERVWNSATNTFVDPPIPTESSEVLVSYRFMRGNRLVATLDDRWRVYYRLTTVALDPTGTTPSGLVETPLGYSPPISPMESEQLDYIWREAIRRNQWILEQGGERVKLFLRRVAGIPCRCVWDDRLREYSRQPMNMCLSCYGTGYVGGYEGPYDAIVGPDESERRVSQSPNGRRLESSYEVWLGPSPMMSQRDFIVKQNGERYSVGPVRRTQVRGLTLQQAFQMAYLDTGDIRYRVPMGMLETLPWPETRYTRPQDVPCEPSDPFPIGCDPPATPMATEVPAIPDGREIRGRTPIWANLTYGGGNNR